MKNERDDRDSLITSTQSHISETEKAVEWYKRELWPTAVFDEAWQMEENKKYTSLFILYAMNVAIVKNFPFWQQITAFVNTLCYLQ